MLVRALIAAALAILAFGAPATAGAQGLPHFAGDRLVKVRLVAERTGVAPGRSTSLAVVFTPKPGWHVYWRNPGDSGAPPTLAWSLPRGFSTGSVSWPAPERIVDGGIVTFVYTRPATLLLPLREARGVPAGRPVFVAADLMWLVCANVCVPGRGHVSARLNVAPSPPRAAGDVPAVFARARAELPSELTGGASLTSDARTISVSIPAVLSPGQRVTGATFFPYDGSAFAQSAPETVTIGSRIAVTLQRKTPQQTRPSHVGGVFAVQTMDAHGTPLERTYAIDARAANVVAPATVVMTEQPVSLLVALALAFGGGIVLNVMPCVFPVLSFKALGAIGDHAPRRRRLLAAAYATGVIASCAALGLLLLALRGAGRAIGWGFQWQSPLFVGLLAILMFALALSLSGVVEIVIPLPGALTHRGEQRFATIGAFTDGALVALVASSCTAPFMGAALGFALTASPLVALGVFVALGAGIATPYSLVTCVPAIAALLPRPGPWMVAARRLLAFPLYATVAWLVWVFSAQTDSNALLALLAALVLTGFGASALGSAQTAQTWQRGWSVCGVAAFAIALALIVPVRAETRHAPEAAAGTLHFERFSPLRLAKLRAAKQRAFVDLSAAWCITCQVNDRLALENGPVARRFADLHVTLLRGDWTNQDPQITAYLETFGRSGVPLYVYYDGRGGVEVWPQLLTPGFILTRLPS